MRTRRWTGWCRTRLAHCRSEASGLSGTESSFARLASVVEQREVREVPEGAGPGHAAVHGEHGAGVRAVPAVRGEAPALLPGSPAGGAEAPGPVEHGQVSALRRGAQGGEVSGWCFHVELGRHSPDLGWRWSQSPPVALRGPAVQDGCLLAQV